MFLLTPDYPDRHHPASSGSAVNIAHACTSAMQTDINTNKTASWRIMDLPELYFNSLAWVPAGFGVQAL